jgi:hypothetical protein
MGKNNNRKQKAKEKAKELLQEVGRNLSAKEAQKVADKAGVSLQQVTRIAERQDVNIKPQAQTKIDNAIQAAQNPPPPKEDPPAPPPGPTNELTNFKGPGGGFGITSYQNAINAGYAPEQIATLLPGSGLQAGEKAQTQLSSDLASLRTKANEADYWSSEASRYSDTAENYKNQLSEYSETFSNLSSQYNDALSKQQSVQAEADSAKKRADELEQQRKDEQEIQVSQQLNSLRGGYTASGSGSTGLGSLSSGSTTRSISTGAKSGSILDRAYQDIDPTDSVLNKDVAANSVAQLRGSSSRTEARQRALAAGGTASSYYSRRFG